MTHKISISRALAGRRPLALLIACLFFLSLGLSACQELPSSEQPSELASSEVEEVEKTESEAETSTSAETTVEASEAETKAQTEAAMIEEAIAIYHELAITFSESYEEARVKRWPDQEIKMLVEGELSDEDLESIKKLIDEVNQIIKTTQFEIVDKVDPEQDRVIYVAFTSPDQFKKDHPQEKLDQFLWYVEWGLRPPLALSMGRIFIDSSQDAATRAKSFKASFLPILGLYNPDYSNDEIALAFKSPQLELSDLDRLIIEMHYRPEISPGTPLEDAEAALRALYLEKVDPELVAAKTKLSPEDEEALVGEMVDNLAPSTAEKWSKMGAEPRAEEVLEESFYDRRDEIEPEFFKLGIQYFVDVAGSGEFDSDHDGVVKKRGGPVFVSVEGDYQDSDLQVLKRLIAQMNAIAGVPEITLQEKSDKETNLKIYYAPLREVHKILDSDMLDQWGIFFYWWTNDPQYEIIDAKIGIATDFNSPASRKHLLQEEFIQSFGLINDSYDYSDSIFQQDWTTNPYPNELDWLLLEMLYRPEITPGMDIDEAVKVLEGLYLGKK